MGLGNDPGNIVDEDGGRGGPVTTLLGSTTGVDVVVKPITKAGQQIGARIINSAFSTAGSSLLLPAALTLIATVLPPIQMNGGNEYKIGDPHPTIPGLSFQGDQFLPNVYSHEVITDDPSKLSDKYLNEAEERLTSGRGTPQDWKYRDEILRRKLSREVDYLTSKLKYGKNSFRENLIKYSGKDPGSDYDAHHIFPQKFRKEFEKLKINIDDPQFATWWQLNDHRGKAKEYNRRWESFDIEGHSREEVIDFGRELMKEFGRNVKF